MAPFLILAKLGISLVPYQSKFKVLSKLNRRGVSGGRPWNRTRRASPRGSYSPLPHLAACRPNLIFGHEPSVYKSSNEKSIPRQRIYGNYLSVYIPA